MLLEKFEKAGDEYENALSLSKETIASLEAPMIPKDEYLRNVNGEQAGMITGQVIKVSGGHAL